ncbi:MAG: enolase N-terminal-like fold-containing protein, partial [Promethearchaeota archaeon]
MILEETVEEVKQIYINHNIVPPIISKVVLGLGYTGVRVSTQEGKSFLGLAATVPSIVNNSNCSKIKFAGNLTNKPIFELMEWSFDLPNIRKIVGLATLNAASQHIFKFKNLYTRLKGGLLSNLKIDRNTTITVIGLMKPLIRKLSKITKLIT